MMSLVPGVGFEVQIHSSRKMELVRSGVGCDRKGQIFGIVKGGTVTIHSSKQTIFSFILIEGTNHTGYRRESR